jgi:negative regulator of flagellin synthesis FlgM
MSISIRNTPTPAAPSSAGSVGKSSTAGKSGEASSASHATGAASAEGKVTISDKTRELAAASSSTVDAAKVERLRAAVNNGSLKIDAHKIANKIVGDGDGDGT